MENRSLLTESTLLFTLMILSLPLSGAGRERVPWKVTASSFDPGSLPSRGPESAFDGYLTTFWSEGEAGSGLGSWLEVDFGSPLFIHEITIFHGNFLGLENFNSYNRLKSVRMLLYDGKEEKEIEWGMSDVYYPQKMRVKSPVQKVRFVIDEVYSGHVYSDTVISEVVFSDGKGDLEYRKRFQPIYEDKRFQNRLEKYQKGLAEAFEICRKGEEYVENFDTILRGLVDGPPFVYDMIKDDIPPGFRFPFISSDRKAAEYISNLKDPTSIPWIQAAKFRTGGESSEFGKYLKDLEKFFHAYIMFKRERPTIEPWGTTGIEKGALQGRGEPISIDIDSLGYVYVADTANHRVQKFDPNGKVVEIWGKPRKRINYEWFGQPSEPYASGCTPGKRAGEFVNPVYIAINYDDVLAVIDSVRRLQFFTSEGKFLRGWDIPYDKNIEFGTGNGNPILSWLNPRYIYVFIGDMAYLYDFKTGKVKREFRVKDGNIRGATVFRKKVYLKFLENRLVQYDLKGWRAGTFLELDDASEDWDIRSDDDFLYILTDEFILYKYDRKGERVKESSLFKAPEISPFRFAVFEDMVFFTYKDEIKRVPFK